MFRKRPSTSVESLDGLLTANSELMLEVERLKAELHERDIAFAELQSKLDQYWDLHENVDYRSLVDQIREEARNVGDVLKALDIGTRKHLARLGPASTSEDNQTAPATKRLLPSVHSLLRTLDKWK